MKLIPLAFKDSAKRWMYGLVTNLFPLGMTLLSCFLKHILPMPKL